jgi:uncharacterized protein (TIGR03435 family)
MAHRIIHRLSLAKTLLVAATAAGLIFLGVAFPPSLSGQSAAALAFEVASVKLRNLPAGTIAVPRILAPNVPFRISGTHIAASRRTLTALVQDAYDVKAFQVYGAPNWALDGGDRYDIEAKAPGDAAPNAEQVRLMFQSLLADRFQLKLHRDSKQLPAYHLVIGKRGSKLRPVHLGAPPSTGQRSVDQFASQLSRLLDRPVIDKTDLQGEFDFTMELLQLVRAPDQDPDSFALEALSSTLETHFGLRLESAKEKVVILVIDRAERPSEN